MPIVRFETYVNACLHVPFDLSTTPLEGSILVHNVEVHGPICMLLPVTPVYRYELVDLRFGS